jgi:hypothetical protein
MSDSEINDDDDVFDQENEVDIKDENAESDILEEEEEQKETLIEEQPQIVIERVNILSLDRFFNFSFRKMLIRRRRRIYSRMKIIRWGML